ncbi:proline dehydrogenase family protein, partial [Vibrio parahaemolyticus EKP-028]
PTRHGRFTLQPRDGEIRPTCSYLRSSW